MKEYNKLMREINKLSHFRIEKTTRKPTVKVVYIESGELYSVHPGDKAVKSLKKWINKFK